MPKDYKNTRRAPARNQKRPAPKRVPWRAFLAGLLCGAISVSGVFLAERFELISFSAAGGARPVAQSASDSNAETEPVSKPHFEFYTMLPEMEVAVKEEEIKPRVRKTESTSEREALDGTYLLQVGSFRKHADADSLKASLALIGLVAEIQTVSINGEETWHRVRIGPFNERPDLNATRERLAANDIEAIVLKKRE